MRTLRMLPLAACVLVGACGGGGGGVSGPGSSPPPVAGGGSTPTPTPAPTPTPTPTPPPTNTTIDDLRVSQTFASSAAAESFSIDRATSTEINATKKASGLTISYDAVAKSYSLTTPDFSQTFGPADMTSDDVDQTQYRKDGETRDYLTLVKTPYSGTTPTRYVGLGFWQRNTTGVSSQETLFGTFTYGLDSPAAAVPRTGTAAFDIDVFGASSFPGSEPRAFQGSGKFSTDFAAGIFSAYASVTEYELVTGSGTSGGGIDVTAAGHLGSDGSFAGNMLYGGFNGAIGGELSGRFYGPDAQELGASFSGGSGGNAVAGSFIGVRNDDVKADNLTLTNLTQSQLFYTQYGSYRVGQLNWQNAETFTLGTPSSDLNSGQFTINDKVAGGRANFTTYRKTFSGTFDSQDVTLELYKPGAGNTELALTYASFGHWSTISSFFGGKTPVDQWFAYGLETPARLLSARTGTGRYDGILYGNGSNGQPGGSYAVRGTSSYAVDFGAQSLSGTLAMTGSSTNGGSDVDFGAFDFAGKLAAYGTASSFTLNGGGQSVGQVETRFFGPDGEEIAGPFSLLVQAGRAGAGTSIAGVAAAKRQ